MLPIERYDVLLLFRELDAILVCEKNQTHRLDNPIPSKSNWQFANRKLEIKTMRGFMDICCTPNTAQDEY